jgi:ACS family tartrate transporter-like MFS transporter
MAVPSHPSNQLPSRGSRISDRTRHHAALRLLPFLFLLYIVNYLDRTSVAYAALGMSRDMGFSDRVIGLGAGIFFVSYVALQIPGALLVEVWSARRTISAILIAWGSLTMLTSWIHTPTQLYLARFVLGVAEAGFFPGVIVYLSHWFIREDRAKATGNFMAAIPLSLVFGSPLAGWILGLRWMGLQGWRWLFILEGVPAVVLGIVAFFYLTDKPRQASWLAPEEREWIEATLEEEKPVAAHSISIWQALRSRTILVLSAAAFFEYLMAYCLFFWLPTLLQRQSGLSDVRVGLLGALPYVAGFFAMLVNGWHSDRTGERRWHSVVPMLISTLGLAGLIARPGSLPLTVALFSMVAIGGSAFLPTFWAIPTENLTAAAAAAGVGMVNAIGSVAGFVGPSTFGYLTTRTGSPTAGLALMTAAALVSGLVLLLLPHAPRPSGAVPSIS